MLGVGRDRRCRLTEYAAPGRDGTLPALLRPAARAYPYCPCRSRETNVMGGSNVFQRAAADPGLTREASTNPDHGNRSTKRPPTASCLTTRHPCRPRLEHRHAVPEAWRTTGGPLCRAPAQHSAAAEAPRPPLRHNSAVGLRCVRRDRAGSDTIDLVLTTSIFASRRSAAERSLKPPSDVWPHLSAPRGMYEEILAFREGLTR